ncbi:MAG: hypothetical protein WDN49_07550 [Acetobacteraceae bacterium]
MIGATALALALMQSLSRSMDYHSVVHVLHAMPLSLIAGTVLATLLGYARCWRATQPSCGSWASASRTRR